MNGNLDGTIIVAIISAIGTAIGSIIGIAVNSSLTRWRLKQLEDKVEKHNSIAERVAIAERDIEAINGEIEILREREAT